MASPVKSYDENPLHYPVKTEGSLSYSNESDCFYGICKKNTYFSGLVVCGTFKRRNDRIMCTFFTLMCAALSIAVIAPLVSPHLLIIRFIIFSYHLFRFYIV